MSASLLVALAVALVSGAATGLTGFGFALVLVPGLLLFYEPQTVVPVTVTLGMITAAVIVLDSWREARVRLVISIMPFAVLGLLAGSEVLRLLDSDYIRLGAGLVVLGAALALSRDVRLPGASTRPVAAGAGFLSGFLSTSAALAGPPIVLLFAARELPKRVFRGSNAVYFTALSLAALAALFLRGVADAGDMALAAALLPAALAGKALGTALVKRTTEESFRRVALALVVLTGALGVATAVGALVQ